MQYFSAFDALAARLQSLLRRFILRLTMVDQTVVTAAQMREWRVKRGMGQVRAIRAATGFVLLSASLAVPAPARFGPAQRAGDANAAPAAAASSAKRLGAT